VVARRDDSSSPPDFVVVEELGPVFARAEARGALIAIDIPVGLSDLGPRSCDVEARRRLGRPRASSVFPAPCRAALGAMAYAEACALSRRTLGRAMSRQCFAIVPKIRQVDALMSPARQAFVREVHPELVFAVLAGRGRGLAHPKRTVAGERLRMRLLRPALPDFDPVRVRARLGPSRVTRDDLIDAAACLVAAERIARGEALVLPAGPIPLDARGLRMEIVA
jgi:predicted RNase H-like nuclease